MRTARRATAVLAALLAAPAAAAGPRAVVPEAVVDVGVVAMGDEVTHEFTLLNQGDADLELTEVRPSCGCTVARHPARIGPGRSGRVRTVLDTSDFRGPVAKSVLVFTNDPSNPRIQLVIKANIQAQVEVRPGYARFIVVQGEGRETSEQTLRANDMEGFAVEKVVSPYPFVEAAFRPAAGESGSSRDGEWTVEIALAEGAPAGPMADAVVVHTNHPRQPRVKIPVSGFVRPPLAVLPQAFDFGEARIAEPLPGRIEIEVLGSRPVRLAATSTDVPGLELELEEVEAGRRYALLVRLTPAMKKGPVAGELVVQTTSALQPEIRIPVTGTVL